MSVAIKTENLTKRFNDTVAVNGLNLSVVDGELFALLGVNGAGKTTAIKMLSCLLKPTEGVAEIYGNNVTIAPQSVKEITAVSPQETAVAQNLTVKENLAFIAQIYGFSKSEAEEKTAKMIEDLGLDDVKNKQAKTLSGGYQRRLSIAMALISEPRVLYLDEPTLGLDVLARRELWQIIRSLKGRVTVVLTTHYLEEAESLADRIGIMSKGRLVAVGTAEEIMSLSGKSNLEEAFVCLASGELYEKKATFTTKGGDF